MTPHDRMQPRLYTHRAAKKTAGQGFIQDFITGGCKQEPGGVTHGYTRDLLTYLLTSPLN